MKPNDIIGQLMSALAKIAETDKPLEASSQSDWRRRAKLVASNAINQANRELRRQAQQVDPEDKDTHG